MNNYEFTILLFTYNLISSTPTLEHVDFMKLINLLGDISRKVLVTVHKYTMAVTEKRGCS